MADWIVEVVGRLGYAGIFLLTLLENVFPPIPSEVIMPLAGFHTAKGELTFWGVTAAGSFGSLLGTLGWYWAGHRMGEEQLRRLIARHGRWLALEEHDVDQVKAWFQRHGTAAVFVCRLMPGLRTLISLPAGFQAMGMWQFLLPSAAGTILWTTALTYAGHLLGNRYAEVEGYLGIASWAAIGIIAVLYVYRQIKFLRFGRQA